MRIMHKAYDVAQKNLDVEVMFPGFWFDRMNLVRAKFFKCTMHGLDVKGL